MGDDETQENTRSDLVATGDPAVTAAPSLSVATPTPTVPATQAMPTTGASSTGTMAEAREAHTAPLHPDGRVLVVGGEGVVTSLATATATSGRPRAGGPRITPCAHGVIAYDPPSGEVRPHHAPPAERSPARVLAGAAC